MLDTDQLRSFLAIVDSGSFTKAAERVHKTQSAVSMHVRRLEEQLGCALFVKHGRGARLTEEGEQLIEFARRIVQVEAGAFAALSRKGLKGRGAARHSGRLRRICSWPTSSRTTIAVIPWSRSRSFASHRPTLLRRSPLALWIWRLITDHEGLKGLEALARRTARLGRLRAVPGGGWSPDTARARQHDLLLAPCDRGGAVGDAGRDAGAVLLQELQRDRHGLARVAWRRQSCLRRWSALALSSSGAPRDCRNCP